MILRIADSEKEPFNTVIDSDDVCFPPTMFRIIKMIPVFNIIYPYWSENNVQLDTVFESLKKCDALLDKLQDIENQGEKYIKSAFVNHNEDVRLIPLHPLKETLEFYQKYRDKAEIVLKDSDLTCIKEYFYEFVRRNCYPDKNGRFNTVFFYENLGVAAMSMNDKVRPSCRFCEVEIVETRSMDYYDQRWLTDLRPTCIFKECFDAVKSYWGGEMTEDTKVEILFSGKYVLKDLG